ncbi:DUF4365 domain-containing protein [Streptomyces sp. HNM0663]|uniref:DUF4365 domain-containing protein n=1 Tax=Streptomyces chengmaiensis TaxID=3040919 RepID=A0ABT6HZD4_9ACTN|nr:DUF4365 domain-containing protein [Streptomyces chengmaiensis]MDH2394078.1 DUF4365 domain-containing protein [Streptomyces chengmaiensis]
MPGQSRSQQIGWTGELWFQAQLPPGWIPQRPTMDVGVDFVVVICEAGPLNGREFRVQVKASENPKQTSKGIVISGVKRSTIDYWFLSILPTMIVAYDHGQNQGYYRWHSDLYDELSWLESDRNTRTVSLAIPNQNKLAPEAWEGIRQALLWHDRNLRSTLQSARNARSILPMIGELAAAIHQLNGIATPRDREHRPIPEPHLTEKQQGLLAILEMIQHQNVIKAVSRLTNELVPGSAGADRLHSWISAYRDTASQAFPKVDQIPDGDAFPPDYEFVFAPDRVSVVRPVLIQATLELIMLLTGHGAGRRATESFSS